MFSSTSQPAFGARADSPMTRWPTELRIVVRCLRAGLGLGQQQRDAADLVAAGRPGDPEPDWERFLGWVARHRVTPLVYAGLKAPGAPSVPDGVRAQLRHRAQANTRRVLSLGCELVRLLEAFAARSIPSLPMKGPALALQVHGDIAMRQFRDLDLLVRSEDLDQAIDVLRSHGYQPSFPGFDRLSGKLRRLYETHQNQLQFAHPETEIIVELHWSALRELWPATLEHLAERAGHVRLADRDIPVFSQEDLMIHLTAHGSRHAWRRLSWLAEFASLIPQTSDEVWGRVCASASRAGVERPLALGLLVSQ